MFSRALTLALAVAFICVLARMVPGTDAQSVTTTVTSSVTPTISLTRTASPTPSVTPSVDYWAVDVNDSSSASLLACSIALLFSILALF